MKKIQILSIMILSGAIAFGAKATAPKAQVNFQESLARVESSGSIADLVINSDKAIHGLQFDITYNPSEIKSITPQTISGFEVKYNELSDGLIRGLVFSLQGNALPTNLPFEFKHVDDDRIEGRRVWVMEFEEVRGPTLIINPVKGIDVPTHGRLWIDPTDGLIARSELKTGYSEGELESEITVRYQPQTDLGVWVPRDMRESYKSRGGNLFEGHARYSNYQRYGVQVEEEVPIDDQEPPRSGR